MSTHGGDEPPRGGVDRSAVPTGLKQHELDAAERLAGRGHRVVFVPVTGKGKIADLSVDGELWELKSISGSSDDAIARNLRRAAKQASHVVLDVTDSPISEETVKRLVRHYARRYRLQSVRVIRGFEELIGNSTMTNSDYIEVRGPKSLAELVAAIDPSTPEPEGDLLTLELGGDEYAAVQYDDVDRASWPYMITIESRSEDEAPVRAEAMRILQKVDAAGWAYRMTSDADDALLIEAQKV